PWSYDTAVRTVASTHPRAGSADCRDVSGGRRSAAAPGYRHFDTRSRCRPDKPYSTPSRGWAHLAIGRHLAIGHGATRQLPRWAPAVGPGWPRLAPATGTALT